MMKKLSKSQFKSRALEIMRSVEQEGKPILITDHGNPVLELRPYRSLDVDPLEGLKGSVVEYARPCDPSVSDDRERGN